MFMCFKVLRVNISISPAITANIKWSRFSPKHVKLTTLCTEKDNNMADRTQGIMNPLATFDQQSEIMDALRSAFGPRSSKPPTLQEELEELSEDRLGFILRL